MTATKDDFDADLYQASVLADGSTGGGRKRLRQYRKQLNSEKAGWWGKL